MTETSEKVREFWLEKCETEHDNYLACWTFEPSFNEGIMSRDDFIHVIEKSAYDRLAEINKVLVKELQTTLDRYEDMSGGFFDSESKRIREVLAKAKEMGND